MVQGKMDWTPTYLEKTENNGDRFGAKVVGCESASKESLPIPIWMCSWSA